MRPPTNWRPSVLTFAFPFVFHMFYYASRRRHHRGFQPSQLPFTGTLVAMGRCGCCAYTLENITPSSTGHLQCPECGSSWHRDRLIAADNPADQDRMATRMRWYRSKQEYAGIVTDDRGVLLSNAVIWPRKRFDPNLPPRFHEWLVQILAEKKRSSMRIPLVVLAILSVLVMALLISGDQSPHESWRFIVVIVTIIALLIAYALSRVNLARSLVRAAYLDLCCCPECNSLLPAGPQQFDGCVLCTKCKHAWKGDALGAPPPDPDLVNSPCHRCGYNAINLAICPECGTVQQRFHPRNRESPANERNNPQAPSETVGPQDKP